MRTRMSAVAALLVVASVLGAQVNPGPGGTRRDSMPNRERMEQRVRERLGGMLRQRFRHGREFGESRVTRHRESRVRLLLSAPLVPLVLVARIGQRVRTSGRHGPRFVAALPWLFILAVAWAAGEVAGAWRADTRRS